MGAAADRRSGRPSGGRSRRASSTAVTPCPPRRPGSRELPATGRGGGHDLHLRTLREQGATLVGRFRELDGAESRFGPTCSRASTGATCAPRFRELVRRRAREREAGRPRGAVDPGPLDATPGGVDLDRIGAVVIAGGYRPDYAHWVHVPGAFDPLGFPVHDEGASARRAGLYFVGVHFLRKRKSALLWGSAKTSPSSPAGSPRGPSRRRSRSRRGSRARGRRAAARRRSRPTRRPSAGTPRGRRA